ncbi:hypothetical protein GLOIN_2v1727082 [Rhizophagus irregularis DAOM 181602=DAOM 197198]|uniref:Uncharacterized protein n=1 Tax=Rhizophagus irregularis (strain DAOM 181602 / DAOM 197198 / MUCL 43194) TaxID=747089 RepID=A0A2P4P0G5_RHIID|nr:hypothetical protein GLOIN_2v1727082 [Rhizophagus irregularis DAOM 181602=DAOM 197198]POG58863.1 hypothetical protein GLOIN_2v1727082 [Rhizophagus irregularis DAOM 181602=DAOM 197198]|eukprot:XP_025165729.1 hypothetical protein GLOIN_2v1727082 [Rhizophagus irregularis DAOM 181602=DAOM 197198]
MGPQMIFKFRNIAEFSVELRLMFHNKTDILLFLLYIGILIFAEKITDHHHAYNRHSHKITHMNLVTCNCTAKVWRSISNKFFGISIFTCRILETLRSIVPRNGIF